MQEEIEMRSVTLGVSTAKLTARVLRTAIAKYMQSQKQKHAQHSTVKPMGKQTVKQLVGQNQGVSNIEISDDNIKSFDRVARKYGVDYAIKKDRSVSPPKYFVFFKARDADALTAAFGEYTAKTLKQKEKASVLKLLKTIKPLEIVKPKIRDKEKELDR